MAQSTRAKCSLKLKAADRGRALVEDWRQPGLSQMAHARQHQVGAHLLSYWSKRFPATKDTTTKAIPHHVQAMIVGWEPDQRRSSGEIHPQDLPISAQLHHRWQVPDR